MKDNYLVLMTPRTIRNRMHEIGYKGYIAREKPLVKKSNRYKCVLWARKHLSRPKEFCTTILWSDESKFNIFGLDGRQTVWRQKHEAMKRECLKVTVKHSGGSIMVWGCMSANGLGNLVRIEDNMYEEQYEKILDENIKQSAKKLKMRSFIFQQDIDSKHTAGNINE